MTGYENVPTAELLQEIEMYQAIQKTHKTTDRAWKMASKMLKPRFKEMAKRSAAQ